MEGADVEFTPDALLEIAKMAKAKDTGARGLRSIVEEIMLDIMFELPDRAAKDKGKFVVTAEVVRKEKSLFDTPPAAARPASKRGRRTRAEEGKRVSRSGLSPRSIERSRSSSTQVNTMSTVERAQTKTSSRRWSPASTSTSPRSTSATRRCAEGTRAELVGGVVYMPSPMRIDHGDSRRSVGYWFVHYQTKTPRAYGAVRIRPSTSARLVRSSPTATCGFHRPARRPDPR